MLINKISSLSDNLQNDNIYSICFQLGTPAFRGSVDDIVTKACKEAEIYLAKDIVCLRFIFFYHEYVKNTFRMVLL